MRVLGLLLWKEVGCWSFWMLGAGSNLLTESHCQYSCEALAVWAGSWRMRIVAVPLGSQRQGKALRCLGNTRVCASWLELALMSTAVCATMPVCMRMDACVHVCACV